MRILSIDGGGIRGILPAAVLAQCEDRFCHGRSAGEFLDYIAGTSTGGIIALGLSIGLGAKDILAIYMEHGSEIFPPRRPYRNLTLRKIQSCWHSLRNLNRYMSKMHGARFTSDNEYMEYASLTFGGNRVKYRGGILWQDFLDAFEDVPKTWDAFDEGLDALGRK